MRSDAARLPVGTARFLLAACVVAVGLWTADASVCAGAEEDDARTSALEPIAADFSNVRGLNYIASSPRASSGFIFSRLTLL